MVVGNHLVGAIVTDGALAVFIEAVPALPDCGCTDADLIQPARALGVQQHLEGGVRVAAVGQRKQDVGRAGEAGANLVITLFNQLDKVLGGLGLDVLREHIQVEGQHVGSLEFVLRLAAAIRQDAAIGVRHLGAQRLILGGILILTEQTCNFGKAAAGIAQAGRGGVLAAALPLAHLGHIRCDPVTEVEHGRRVPDVAVLADAEPCPEAAGLDVFLHRGVHGPQDVHIAGGLIQGPRHVHAGVAPPVHGHLRHRCGETVALHRHGVGQAAGGQLLGLDVAQPLLQKAAQLKVVQSRGGKDVDITGPAHALVALGAVGGNVHKVGLGAPGDVGLQLVEHLIRAVEPTVLCHIGVEGHSLDFQLLRVNALDPGITEAHVAEARAVFLLAIAAGVGGRSLGRAQEGGVQRAVRV